MFSLHNFPRRSIAPSAALIGDSCHSLNSTRFVELVGSATKSSMLHLDNFPRRSIAPNAKASIISSSNSYRFSEHARY
jgi:hypothetical protein